MFWEWDEGRSSDELFDLELVMNNARIWLFTDG